MWKKKIQNYLLPLVSSCKAEFKRIDALLMQNQNESLSKIAFGNVLVTGATVFLGSHIVRYLLEDDSVEKVFCIVRSKGRQTAKQRLKMTLFYYFSDISDAQIEEKNNCD